MYSCKCKNCNGIMELNGDDEGKITHELICPYCGSKDIIVDSDAVAVEKIKSKAYKDVEYAKMEHESKMADETARKDAQRWYRKGKFSKITVFLMFICLIVGVNSFKNHQILKGIIAIAQTGLFMTSWMMGMQIIKEKIKNLHVLIGLVGMLLIIPFAACGSDSKDKKDYDKLNWPSAGLATLLPDVDSKYGKIYNDNDDYFSADIEKYDEDKYNSYVNECIEKGFTEDRDNSSSSYSASDKDGNELTLVYLEYSEEMSITLYSAEYEAKLDSDSKDAEEASDDKESDSEDAEEASDDKDSDSEDASEDKDSDAEDAEEASEDKDSDSEDAEEASDDKDSDSGDASGVDPDFKAAMDSYEEFFDEYIEFMKAYDANDPSMLKEYTDYMTKYTETMTKLNEVDESKLSAADDAYYIEVNTRINQKLLEVSSSM